MGDVVGAIQQIEDLSERRRGRVLVDERDAAEVMAAVQILVQKTRPDVTQFGIDDGGFAAKQADGAADAHGRHRRGDLHAVAGMRDLSGDKGEGTLDQGEQGVVRRAAVGVERIVVERHSGAGYEIVRCAVGEGDAAGRIGTGLDDVALINGVADMQRSGDAVMDEGDLTDGLFDLADGFRRQRRVRLRLCVVAGRRRAGQQTDNFPRKMRAIRREEVRMLLGSEIAGNDVPMTVLTGQDEIGARSREMAPEQQLGVGNIDTVRVRCIDLENGRINPVAALD